MKVLFVASEARPLLTTGGLGEVCGSLPRALRAAGLDVRLLLPAYRDVVARAGRLKPVSQLLFPGLATPVTLLEGALPGTRVRLWLLDHPPAFDRPGNPYLNTYGHPWHDNAARFALFARGACALALGRAGLRWRPDVVHAHDWQTGLVPALLAQEPRRPATVFTVHNLSYQGLFPYDTFAALNLPPALWTPDALEFHGQLSFIKGGLACADRITTVSPTYAREIQTPEFGCGLEGLLRHRAKRLHGILNGIDDAGWNPARDAFLVRPYSARRLGGKQANKHALQQELGLAPAADVPLIGMVGRLVPQKGIDLALGALAQLSSSSWQMAVLGSGAREYEQALQLEAARRPGGVAVRLGYDEALSHRIMAGADLFLLPSRFEPCGLGQLYALRYGTVPVVRRVGGLADTVVDATPANLKSGRATGFTFEAAEPGALAATLNRALLRYRDTKQWHKLAAAGMRQDFSWRRRAREYLQLYRQAVEDHSRHDHGHR